jgi:hypothetical protein
MINIRYIDNSYVNSRDCMSHVNVHVFKALTAT